MRIADCGLWISERGRVHRVTDLTGETTDATTSHLTNPAKYAGQVIGYSHSTRLPAEELLAGHLKDGNQVAGYQSPASYCIPFNLGFSVLNPQSAIRNPQSSKGFTLIELIVVIAVLSVLAGTLLNRVWLYQEQAEKAAMVGVASAIQGALVMQYGRLLVRGMESEVTALTTDNPMRWLAIQPRNYSGEFYDPTPRSVAPGNWVFDLKTRELVYVLDRASHFIPGKDGQKWIRYRANLMYDPALGAPGKTSKELAGVLFEPTMPYHWFD